MPNYTDKFSEDPGLNFKKYAKELAKIAIKATTGSEGAFTIGIFGSWGSGKTTLMRCIEYHFKNFQTEFRPDDFEIHLHNFQATNCKTIWFNPWKYDDKEDINNALIQTILREMAANSQSAVSEKCNKLATRYNHINCLSHIGEHIGAVVLQSLCMGINPIEIVKGLQKLRNFSEDRKDNNELDSDNDPYLFINGFEDKFREVVKEYVGEAGKLIIFIDDLDRCLPENALTVLESLKLYLDHASCIFFIGLDRRVIEQAVKHRYNKELNITGKEYIEKMIQLNFFLPAKDKNTVKGRLFNELNELTHPTANPEYSPKDGILDMIFLATQANLRKTKQFIIAFDLVKSIAKELKILELETHKKLAKILLVQMNYPAFYDELQKNHIILKSFGEIFAAEKQGRNEFNEALSKYPECKKFWGYSNLVKFLQDSSMIDISDPKELECLLHILSQTGSNAG